MDVLLIIFGCVIGTILCAMLVVFLCELSSYRSTVKNEQTISFDDFLKLYSVAPKKWNTSYDWLVKYEGTSIYMKSYFDEKRYKRWRNNQEQIKIDQSLANQQMRLLKKWQEDINQYQEKYTAELKKMMAK